ncbi:hypothetical protein BBJ28_00010707 [Nothophytophthora sp. Chile5]|nr:hypothetical protein BBJ28_00010707 [Nothophytophthora sp. Chile5]
MELFSNPRHRAWPKNVLIGYCSVLDSAVCSNNAKTGYAYCCAAHDPSFASSYFSPQLFSDLALRDRCEDQVVAKYSKRDLYHSDILDLKTPGFVELDHILEKQCFSYAFRFLDFRDGREDIDFVASIVREEIVNKLPNLCLTRTTTNRIKGAAVWRFLDDCLTGHVGAADTFTGYLLAENRDGMRLGRKTTRIITHEMGTALKYCQRRLSAQGETPILDELSSQLQALYVKMEIRAKDATDTQTPDEPKPALIWNVNAKPFVPQAVIQN